MDGQEYLNQISAANRPLAQKSHGFLSSKFFKVGLIGIVALILIIILGSILGSGKGGEKNLSISLYLHISNTNELIKKYQSDIKSSDLRSNAASLSGILSDVNSKVESYLTEKYKFKAKDIEKKTVEEAKLEMDALDSELFNAKINGILDRIFAHKIAYEVSMIMSEEAKLLNAVKNEDYRAVIEENYNSLKNLYDKFNDFSEAKS